MGPFDTPKYHQQRRLQQKLCLVVVQLSPSPPRLTDFGKVPIYASDHVARRQIYRGLGIMRQLVFGLLGPPF